MNALALALMQRAPVVMLVSLRVGLVLALMPAPFGDVAPVRIRAALGFLLSMTLCIAAFPQFPALGYDTAALIEGLTTELVIGAVMGLTVRVTLAASEIAGTVAGHAIGLGFASTIDPTFGDEGVPTTTLFNGLSVITFFSVGGHYLVFQALLASLDVAPPGLCLPALHSTEIIAIGGRMVAQGLRIASPVVATMFIVQIGTALVARSAPRVQIFALSFGITLSVGSLILIAAAPQFARSITASLAPLLPTLIGVLHGGGP
jgi:flagellar biosynthetic protein FliR